MSTLHVSREALHGGRSESHQPEPGCRSLLRTLNLRLLATIQNRIIARWRSVDGQERALNPIARGCIQSGFLQTVLSKAPFKYGVCTRLLRSALPIRIYRLSVPIRLERHIPLIEWKFSLSCEGKISTGRYMTKLLCTFVDRRIVKRQSVSALNQREPQLWSGPRSPPGRCRLRIMPARETQPRRQVGVPGESDSRWNAIWQLVLQAEQLPAGERSAFMQSADTDPFIIRQAVRSSKEARASRRRPHFRLRRKSDSFLKPE
jgi:hypothetical protein